MTAEVDIASGGGDGDGDEAGRPFDALSVPAYLMAPPDIRDEARLCYALNYVIPQDGVPPTDWLTRWETIANVLKSRAFPAKPTAHLKEMKRSAV